MQKATGFLFSNHYASTQLDRLCSPENKPQVLAIMAKLHGLICLHIADAEPQSPEAKRRLTFFVNSLFMNVPKVGRHPHTYHLLCGCVAGGWRPRCRCFSLSDLLLPSSSRSLCL